MRNQKQNKKNEEEPIVKRPASCEDLKLMGHLLNGFYFVQPNESNMNNFNNKIRMVYCDFSVKKAQSSQNLPGIPIQL